MKQFTVARPDDGAQAAAQAAAQPAAQAAAQGPPAGARAETAGWRRAASQLWLFAGAVTALIVGVTAFNIWRDYQDRVAAARRDSLNIVRVVAAHAAQGIGGVALNLQSIDSVINHWPSGARPNPAQIEWLIRGRVRLNPDVRTILILDREGRLLHTASDDRSQVGSSFVDRGYFAWHRAHPDDDAVRIGAPVTSRTRGTLYIPVTRRLTGADGAFDGVIVASLEPHYLEQFYQSVDMGPQGRITIFLRDGTLLVRTPANPAVIGRSFANTQLFGERLPAAPEGSYDLRDTLDGVERISSYTSLKETGLVVSAAFGRADVLAGWRREAATDVALSAVLIATLLALSALLARRLRAEHALAGRLAKGERQYRALVETAREGIWRVDAGRIVRYANPAMAQMLGYAAESDILGRPTRDFVHPDDWERVSSLAAHSRASGEPARFELRYLRRDGGVYPTITSISVLGGGEAQELLGMATDISDRLAAEAQVRRNLARLEGLHGLDRAILEARTREEIAATGLAHLRNLVPFWGAVAVLFDHAAGQAEVIGFARRDASNPGPRGNMSMDDYGRDEIAQLAQGDRIMVPDLDARQHTPRRLAHLRAAGLKAFLSVPMLAEGELVGVLTVGRDTAGMFYADETAIAREIADHMAIALRQAALVQAVARHASELEARVEDRTRDLAAANAELQRANQELESFSYAVSHDLRAPARHVAGFAAMLREELGTPGAEAAGLLARIETAASRMMDLIDDLLSLAETSRREMRVREVDLAALVAQVRDELAHAPCARAVQWVVGELPPARGDAALLRVVLHNLLGNAVKYSSRAAAPRVEVGVRAGEGGAPEFYVRDNGAGFDMARAGKLFTPFTRLHAKSEFEGTGIGLATVKRIVERHGGRVRAEGSPGAGATFSFTLGAA